MPTMKRITKMILVAMLLVILFTNTAFAQPVTTSENEQFMFFQNVKEFITNNYKEDVSEVQLLEAALAQILKQNPEVLEQAMEGMFNSLDQHSTFYNQHQYQQFTSAVEGQYGGIGIVISKRDGYVTIMSTMDNTPGKRAGLRAEDKIVYVNELDITGYDTNMAVSLMRGDPGTIVELGIKRPGEEEILYVKIVREIIKVNPLTYEVLEGNIGYIRISDFNANTDEYMRKVLREFDMQQIEKIIVDVRSNPGGSLDQVIKVAQRFVPEGPIVHIEYKQDEKETIFGTLPTAPYELVVLINTGSASASEILAGAIQDRGVGKVVGVPSFGKGTVQQLLPLRIGGAIKMTIANYLTPNGDKIEGKGIIPNLMVENVTKAINTDELEPVEILRRPTIGDRGKDVLAAKQRLHILGYDVGQVNEELDEKTFNAIKSFQAEQKLYPYGVLDFTTQGAIDNAIKALEVEVDMQLQKAIELLR